MNEVAIMLHRVVAALDRAGDRLLREELGISHSRAVLLLVVDRDPGLSQSDLAEALGCTAPAVTSLLREVLRDGYVEVSVGAGNHHRKLVTLTPKGAEVVRAASELLDGRAKDLLRVARVDGEAFLAVLTQLADTLTKPRSS
jgi:DNA-binding MarR family transcriptional regulator